MGRKLIKWEEKIKKSNNSTRFALLPIATLLYGYGITSFAVVFAILIICIIRKDFIVLKDLSIGNSLIIILGVIIFFPARRFRKLLFDNH